jgi:hypothetical protein
LEGVGGEGPTVGIACESYFLLLMLPLMRHGALVGRYKQETVFFGRYHVLNLFWRAGVAVLGIECKALYMISYTSSSKVSFSK